MTDNFVVIDNIYRSRLTLLDILEERGYAVDAYRKFSPVEATAAVADIKSLNLKVSKKNDENKHCDIQYFVSISRQALPSLLDDVTDKECETTEYIIMLLDDQVSDVHHKYAVNQYAKTKENSKERRNLRVSFFNVSMLVINPLRHVLVPKHEIVPPANHKELQESLYITSKSKLPEIKYHVDPITRCIGAVPGDIVKITRYSASSGEAIIYRVCSP